MCYFYIKTALIFKKTPLEQNINVVNSGKIDDFFSFWSHSWHCVNKVLNIMLALRDVTLRNGLSIDKI